MDVLIPKVDLHTLDMEMTHDERLSLIAERIYDVIYNDRSKNARPPLFYFRDRDQMWLTLRANRLSTSDRLHAEQLALEEWSSKYSMPYYASI